MLAAGLLSREINFTGEPMNEFVLNGLVKHRAQLSGKTALFAATRGRGNTCFGRLRADRRYFSLLVVDGSLGLIVLQKCNSSGSGPYKKAIQA